MLIIVIFLLFKALRKYEREDEDVVQDIDIEGALEDTLLPQPDLSRSIDWLQNESVIDCTVQNSGEELLHLAHSTFE